MATPLSSPSALAYDMDKLTNISTSSLVGLAIGFYAVYVLGTWIYNVYFHPLRNVPGPWLAAATPMWLMVVDLTFQKTHKVHELLETYGGIVRIEPNQVAFLDQGATRVVYNKFPKSSWYKGFLANDNDHAMTVGPPLLHAVRKRAYAPHYVPTNVALYQPEIHEFTNELMDKIRLYDGKKPWDCLVLFRRSLVDTLFFTTYGQRIQCLKQWDVVNFTPDPTTRIVGALMAFPIRGAVKMMAPKLIWSFIDSLPIPAIRPFLDADRDLAQYVIRAKDQVIANDPNFKTTGNMNTEVTGEERLSLVHRLMRQSIRAKAEDRLTEGDVIAESMAHTIAGVDTTDTTLSFLCYTLATRPDILAKLREEIDPLMYGEEGKRHIPDYSVLSQLPYLNAVYYEALRLFTPTPAPLERVVPASLNGQFEIKGHKLPAGTIVATQLWSIHRDPTVFPEPLAFKPERWLNATEEMRANWMPYGMGARVCAGMNLAHITFRVMLVSIVRNFDLILPAETTEESMAPITAFILMNVGHKINMIFKERA